MTDQQEIEQQLMELQSRMAYQEDLLDSLNATVVTQDREILALKRQVLDWSNRFQGLLNQLDSQAGNHAATEKPPHY